MSSKPTVSFADQELPDSGALVLFAGNDRKTGKILHEVDKKSAGQVRKAMDHAGFQGSDKHCLDLLTPNGHDFSRLLVIGVGNMKNAKPSDFISLGGRIAGYLKNDKSAKLTISTEEVEGDVTFSPQAAAHLAMGFLLRRYKFGKYKSLAKNNNGNSAKNLNKLVIGVENPQEAAKAHEPLTFVREGVELARNLVNEPANMLGPVEFAMQARELEKMGVIVDILDEAEMAQKGMNALLAVGQGSEKGSRLAVMQWNGADNKNEKPVAIIGKGVCFDSGGISIKPSSGMEDMKGDMGGAACVVGLMKALAGRKAKANVVGVIGLTENMPDGRAQRPGDVVTSMSGQTIEVINTDAEGRLVLADALWYAKETYKPKLMIDLATLTGAILVA